MLWFIFILGLRFFELVSILFAIVLDYGNEYMTKENKNWTSFKNFAPRLNLNHNIYTVLYYDQGTIVSSSIASAAAAVTVNLTSSTIVIINYIFQAND